MYTYILIDHTAVSFLPLFAIYTYNALDVLGPVGISNICQPRFFYFCNSVLKLHHS